MWNRARYESEDSLPAELQNALEAYRFATPDTDASPNFMPALWARIESRRRATRQFGRLSRGLVTFAGGVCLVCSFLLWAPISQFATYSPVYYIDVLAVDSEDDGIEVESVLAESL